MYIDISYKSFAMSRVYTAYTVGVHCMEFSFLITPVLHWLLFKDRQQCALCCQSMETVCDRMTGQMTPQCPQSLRAEDKGQKSLGLNYNDKGKRWRG